VSMPRSIRSRASVPCLTSLAAMLVSFSVDLSSDGAALDEAYGGLALPQGFSTLQGRVLLKSGRRI
jgi:hypothetical protein